MKDSSLRALVLNKDNQPIPELKSNAKPKVKAVKPLAVNTAEASNKASTQFQQVRARGKVAGRQSAVNDISDRHLEALGIKSVCTERSRFCN